MAGDNDSRLQRGKTGRTMGRKKESEMEDVGASKTKG
jgi:hypothetical protein